MTQINAIGKLRIVVTDATGNTKEDITVNNMVVTTGKNFIASRCAGTTPAVMSHMSIGSSTAAAVAADTKLGTELGRAALTSTTVSDNTVTYTATFNPGVGTGAVTEAGIFNAATAGSMLCRTVFAVINKAAADTMTISWNVTIS